MSTTEFSLFHQAFPPTGDRVPFDASKHGELIGKVPAALANEWRNFGFGPYGDGLLWLPVPDEPFLDPDDWEAIDDSAIEVVRSAFASVCVWQSGKFIWQNVHTGKATALSSRAENLFNALLPHKPFIKGGLHAPLFKAARKRFGELSAEECFGFAPLPALGGAMAKEYIVKTQMRPYVSLAAQVLS